MHTSDQFRGEGSVRGARKRLIGHLGRRALAALLVLACVPTNATAQSAPPPPPAAPTPAALARLDAERLRAAELAERGEWAEALAIYEGLRQEFKSPRELWPIALLQQRLGRLDEALRSLKDYASEFPADQKPVGRAEEEALLERVIKGEQRRRGTPAAAPTPTRAPCPDLSRHKPKVPVVPDDPAMAKLATERKRAEDLVAQGAMAEALAIYEAQHETYQSPRELWPIAVLRQLVGRPAEALEALRAYREQFPPPKPAGRAEEEALLEQVLKSDLQRGEGAHPARVVPPPCPDPGLHRPVQPSVPTEPTIPPPRRTPLGRILGGVALGLGAAGIAAGAAGWALREQAAGEYNGDGCLDFEGHTRDETCGDVRRRVEGMQGLAIGGMVAGGALAVTGAALLGTSFKGDLATKGAWRLSPGPGQLGLALHLDF